MVKASQTLIAGAVSRSLVVMFAFTLLGFAARAEASPFVISLLSSDSSGGAGGASSGSSAGGGASSLGLNLGGGLRQLSSGSGLSSLGQTNLNAVITSDASGSNGVASLVSAVKSAIDTTGVSGSVAQLDLGNGEYLTVSSAVSESLVSSVSPVLSTTNEASSSASASADNAIKPSQPATQGVANDVTSGGNPVQSNQPSSGDNAVASSIGNAITNETVKEAFGDIAAGIISSPIGITNPSIGGASAVAEDPISAPEPASLVLLASALALTAHRLRRPRA